MKYAFALILCLVINQFSEAQFFENERLRYDANQGHGSTDNDLLRWGYLLGFNSFDFNFDYYNDKKDIAVVNTFGFNIGLLGNLRINDLVSLRFEPTFFFSNRDLFYSESYFDKATVKDADLKREVVSTYIHLPLLMKISTVRADNFKPFLVGGFSTAFNLSSNEDNPSDNSELQFRTKRNMFFYEFGFGIDFYLPNFKFSPSIRGIFAINDEHVKDADTKSPWTSNISSMKTRGVFVNFTFQ